MNEEIKTTSLAWTVRNAELYGAIMAFSRRDHDNIHGFLDTHSFSTSNKSEPDIDENLALFCQSMGIKSSGVIRCNQVHGDHILICETAPDKIFSADAIITTKPGLYPSIRTADCVPILIIDRLKKVSAAIHAGWRGTVLRIVRKTLLTLRNKFKCDNRNMIVSLGPCIGKCCYEVDSAVLNPLFQNIPWATEFAFPFQDIFPGRNVKRKLDLAAINQFELIKFGISEKNIFRLNMCTCCNEGDLHSYRRDGDASGRSIAITGFRL